MARGIMTKDGMTVHGEIRDERQGVREMAGMIQGTSGGKRIALVGHTGFVGSNLSASAGPAIGAAYNSKNIGEAYGTCPDLLIYAGLRAEKYLANNAPEKDLALIVEAEENIRKIQPKRLVLISTIDVFQDPRGVYEGSVVETDHLAAYGYNRYQLELWVREHCPDALIVRLPGLFGKNIKKNFIYDYIHVIPFRLSGQKMEELSARDLDLHVGDDGLKSFYEPQDNGFYKVRDLTAEEESTLKGKFRELGFSALHFTDSRSKYQFYNLAHLWGDIQIALDAGLTLWHPATEPISAGELYHFLTGKEFVNELGGQPADYDYRTLHASLFGGRDGYIATKEQVMGEIQEFVESNGK